jgi:site-specific DNA-cytosine methylase
MSKPIALGANIFAGGFSLGVSKHFRLLGHLEHDDGYGAEVSSRNLKVPIYVGKEQWPDKVGKLDFLYANPPCAIWSTASGRPGHLWRQDPRLQRIRDIFNLIDIYHPPVWCWESVCQAFNRGREFVEELADEAKKRGYSATYLLIDAAYLGTPQHRKRFFLVLHNIEIDWKTPDFTKVMTAGQALRGVKVDKALLSKMTPGEMKILRHTKPGDKLARVYDRVVKKPKIGSRGQKLGRPSFLKRRLDPALPSSTVIGNAIFHPKQDRFLAVNETAALCGFPQTWWWPKSDGYNLLARGVMPPVGEWLARHVAAAVRKKKKIRPGRWLVDFRQPPGRVVDLHGGNLPVEIDLDWKPGDSSRANVSAHQHKASGRTGKGSSSRGSRPLQAAKAASGGGRRKADGLSLADLAEATRRGIPDKNGRERIRVALRLLKAGRPPSGSGLLIRARLLEGKMGDAEIVKEVLKRYPNRKTTLADVGYHKYKMRRGGMIA